MNSLNSKREGGFSRYKSHTVVGKYGKQPSFSGQKKERVNLGQPVRLIKKHTAACARCKKRCEALSVPTREKPLYCRNCFTAERVLEDG